MRQSSTRIEYLMTQELDEVSHHGLLLPAYQFAERIGLFRHWQDPPLKMKTVVYSPLDKLKTIWASIVIGCQHTFEINIQLGAHEKALALLFGLTRFPDQSQIDRLLLRCTEQMVEWFRQKHFELLCQHTRSREHALWLKLENGGRILVADLDQRALVVSGKQFELANKGHFGRHRGHAGYQLSLLFLGGAIGEVVDEHFDPGNTQAKVRVRDLLDSLSRFCERQNIRPSQLLLRGDAQFGTPAIIALVESYGFKYLFKGISSQKARKLAEEMVTDELYQQVKPGAESQKRWMADLGTQTHYDHSEAGGGRQKIRCRTLVMRCVWPSPRPNPKHHGKKNKEQKTHEIRYDYFLTNLKSSQLPVERVLELYDDRVTIERYFCDEQNALGARSVRTKRFYGEALFQYMVATTNNILRWLKEELLEGTEFEDYGLKRITRQLMQIPARLIRRGKRWIVEVSHLHALGCKLLDQWQTRNALNSS